MTDPAADLVPFSPRHSPARLADLGALAASLGGDPFGFMGWADGPLPYDASEGRTP